MSIKQAARAAILVAAAAMLAGCASPYAQKGLTGGYTDQKISEGVYHVVYDGNGYTNEDMVVKFWLYRCAELTRKNGYAFFGLLDSGKTSMLPEPTDEMYRLPAERGAAAAAMRPAVFRPSDDAAMVQVKGSGGAPRYIYVPGGSYTVHTWHKRGTIAMYKTRVGAVVPEQEYALRASTVLQMLKPFVDSGGKEPGPSRTEVIDAAIK